MVRVGSLNAMRPFLHPGGSWDAQQTFPTLVTFQRVQDGKRDRLINSHFPMKKKGIKCLAHKCRKEVAPLAISHCPYGHIQVPLHIQ